ncbi:hypothetical protein L208DRAFT_915782 [Tricholoma matsutake]|nr:hypothetical protein L208DRAFT_915782 [Tricholoma matsutake 945]
MAAFERTINIRSNDLGDNAILVLTFDTSVSNMFRDVFPIACKAFGFGASGPYQLRFTYKSQLGFTVPQIEGNRVVTSSTHTALNAGHATTLTKHEADGTTIYSFSPPEWGAPTGMIRASNETHDTEVIGVGFYTQESELEPSTALTYDVGRNSNITVEFSPVLSAYVTSNYRENEMIKGGIQSPVLWREDLGQLGSHTNWRLQRRPSTGGYEIIADTARYPPDW